MPYKDPAVRKEKQAEYARKHYEGNKQKSKARVRARKKRIHDLWVEYKATLVCWYCGETSPECIDLHHVIASGKKHQRDSASGWVNWASYSFQKILKLIEETCVPLCSNCHRKVHEMHRRILREQQNKPESDIDGQTV